MSHDEKMKIYHEKYKHQLTMGGAEKLKLRKKAGKLNARERINSLLDSNTFQEIGIFSHSSVLEEAEQTPGDGKIIGHGLVNGRQIGVISGDMTVKGGSSAFTNMKKIEYMRAWSCESEKPLVYFNESTGARMPDIMGTWAMSQGGQNKLQYRRYREAPWIAALMGPSFGSGTWYSVMSDIAVMLKGAVMAVSSPKVTRIATGEDTPWEELGGWKLHYENTGLVDAVADTEQECIELVKKYLSYLPQNAKEPAPLHDIPERSGDGRADILDLLPEKSNRAYDMLKIIKPISDGGQILELKAKFSRQCITAFAGLGGKTVGIIANNPQFMAGALDADSCDKITSFLVLCDSYNIPIVMLVDTPGFLIGKAGEYKKVTGKIINWMNALSLVSVPIFTIIVRKTFGQAYLNMGAGKYSTVIAAWPTAEISFMSPEPGINVLFNLKQEDNPEKFEELKQMMSKNSEPWVGAGIFGLHDIIDPRETRDFLIKMLAIHCNRPQGHVGKHLMHNWPTSY
jgi:acetyl-CoA carboxylase carboxyltransferase component